ncbi:MAG: hypothetical protein IT492_03215 [Gammaproteobacteria bacterium]|nr:hypothetical protein [Gammaproteobacteria bacterium]
MGKAIKIISDGLFWIAESYIKPRDYVVPTKGGFASDQERLAGDLRKVGSDMRKVIERKRVEPTHKPASKGSRRATASVHVNDD